MKSKMNTFFLTIFLLLVIILGEIESIREIRYLIAPISLLFYLSNISNGNIINYGLINLLKLFFLLIPATFLFSYLFTTNIENQNIYLVKDFIFITAPIFSVILLNRSKYFKYKILLFFSFVILTFYQMFMVVLEFGSNDNTSIIQFILYGSNSSVEGSLAFIYGFLVFYLFIEKRYRLFFASSIVLFFFGKRIVFFGVVITCITYLTYFKFVKPALFKWSILVLFIIVSIFMYLFAGSYFNDFVLDNYSVSLNAITQGRYQLLNDNYSEIEYSTFFFGNGYGFTTSFLINNDSKLNLIHSDIFRLFIESGIIGTLLFYNFFYKKLHDNSTIIFGLLFLIISISDNILVYGHVMFYYYLIVSNLNQSAKNGLKKNAFKH